MKEIIEEPAFATSALLSGDEDVFQAGMSKRFYAACAAMQGLCALDSRELDNDWVVRAAFNIADKLLEQENK